MTKQRKIFHAYSGKHPWYNIRSFSKRILITGLFSVTVIVAIAPYQKTCLILPFLCRSLGQRMAYQNLTFSKNVLFPIKDSLKLFSTDKLHNSWCWSSFFIEQVSGSLQYSYVLSWYPSLYILLLYFHFYSKFQLFQDCLIVYCSLFNICFSELTILFFQILFTFFMTTNSLVSLSMGDSQFYYIIFEFAYQRLLFPLIFQYNHEVHSP